MSLSNASSESESLSQSLLTFFDEMSSHVICVTDVITGEYLFISKIAQKLFGYSHEKLCTAGLPFLCAFLHPEDKDRVKAAYAARIEAANLSGPQPDQHFIYTDEYRLRQADGRWIWIESKTAFIAYTPEGKVHKAMSLVSDITEKKAEKNLLWNESTSVIKPHQKLPVQHREKAGHSNSLRSSQANMNQLVDHSCPRNIPVNISSREVEVLRLIARGYSSKILAAELNISQHTADSHRKNLLAKFNVKNTAELVNEAYKCLWIQ